MSDDHGIEARVDALCAAGELRQAAALLDDAGAHVRAARLYERACDFAAAAHAALEGAALRDALRLAVLSGEDTLAERVVQRVLTEADESAVELMATDLVSRSYHRHGAVLFRGIAAFEQAASAYERAGCAREASDCWDRAGQPAKAARVLEAGLRSGQEQDPDSLRVALGLLYGRHDKHEAAVRVLQQVPKSSEHRRGALRSLLRSLRALGLRQAIRDLEPELRRRGVDGAKPARESPSKSGADATLYGRYRIVREVAVTPHARLLEAEDTLSGDRVAVKIFATRGRGSGRDALSRFVREARALTRLRHPNIVGLREYIAEGPAMVLRWMAGGSLRELLERESLSPARAAEIACAVLSALGEAHRLGVLHRDVKPSNLLFDEGGTAMLADFGAAHMASSGATVTVGEIGTAAYMAPEQRAGKAAAVQSDLYAVGVLLFEMLTGQLPELGKPITVRPFHLDLVDGHDDLLCCFLQQRPQDRFGGALEARQAIEALDWPTRIIERDRGSQPVPSTAACGASRLERAHRNGDRYDRWLGRDVLVRPADDATLAQAAAFARAGHEALATVLRVDGASGEVWIDAPRGRPLSQGLCLSDADRARLGAALVALHEAGGVHGSVDPQHVWVHAGMAYLAFPSQQSTESPADDLTAIRAL